MKKTEKILDDTIDEIENKLGSLETRTSFEPTIKQRHNKIINTRFKDLPQSRKLTFESIKGRNE